MDSAEFDTRRRQLGLSEEEASEICGVSIQTIREWQLGPVTAPVDAFAKLDELTDAMIAAAAHVVRQTSDLYDGRTIYLPRYFDREHQETNENAASIPFGAHAMLIAWTASALEEMGYDVKIVWAD